MSRQVAIENNLARTTSITTVNSRKRLNNEQWVNVNSDFSKRTMASNTMNDTFRANNVGVLPNSIESVKLEDATKTEHVFSMSNPSVSNINASIDVCSNIRPNPTTAKKLEDFIEVEETFILIEAEMDEILSRPKTRINSEREIIDMLSFFLKPCDPGMTLATFGSVTYGFGGPRTDLNILVIPGKN